LSGVVAENYSWVAGNANGRSSRDLDSLQGLMALIAFYEDLRNELNPAQSQGQKTQNTISIRELENLFAPQETSERPTVSALRCRLVNDIHSSGVWNDRISLRRLPITSLVVLRSQIQTASDNLVLSMMEIEARLLDEPPKNQLEARAKARLLVDLLKEEGVFDPAALAFSLEECLDKL